MQYPSLYALLEQAPVEPPRRALRRRVNFDAPGSSDEDDPDYRPPAPPAGPSMYFRRSDRADFPALPSRRARSVRPRSISAISYFRLIMSACRLFYRRLSHLFPLVPPPRSSYLPIDDHDLPLSAEGCLTLLPLLLPLLLEPKLE